MKTPFIYGKLAVEDNFTNRTNEINHLIKNFDSGVNTILISPRRWGKSSLVAQAVSQAKQSNKEIKFCFIDMFNIRSEEQFYKVLAEEVINNASSKIEGIIDIAKTLLGNFIPKISINPIPDISVELGLNWNEVKRNPDEIINLAEKIAINKNIQFVICIDEFQNMSNFENPLAFQKKLRSHWQKHQQTSYCLYGSKRHMLMDVFTNTSMPFYKFGDLLFLQKIKEKEWIPFIVKRFNDTNKTIDNDKAAKIAFLADYHPYYVQQLAQQTWFRAQEKCTNENINEAYIGLIEQLSLLFQTKTDELIETQVNLLKAILKGEKQLSSQRVLKTYHLGTSANILKAKKSLIKKEIIENIGNSITFLDPMYKQWLTKHYFKI